MKRSRAAFVILALALALAWVPAVIMTAFAYDQPTVPADIEILRSVMAITLDAFPIIWILTIGLLILELKKKKELIALTVSTTAAYAVSLAHTLAWLFLLSS